MCSEFVPRRRGSMVHVMFSADGTSGDVPVITKDMTAYTEAGVSHQILQRATQELFEALRTLYNLWASAKYSYYFVVFGNFIQM